MFCYTNQDLFDRCGAIDVFYNEKEVEFSGEFIEVGNKKIPLKKIHTHWESKFTRCLCLKTWLGYIPVDKVTCFKDIFNKENYLQDDTEWVIPYHEQSANEQDRAKVKQLSARLGKHWKQ